MQEKVSFILRSPQEVHNRLKEQAVLAGLSLNEFCIRKLMGSSQTHFDFLPLAQIDTLCSFFQPEDLIGVLLYGSYARKEHTPQSDIDILIVLHSRKPLIRSLYTEIDSAAGDLGKVEVHLSHLPTPELGLSSLWAEIALDGIVLYEKNLALTQVCQQLRKQIASGAYVRKITHGQAYWVHNQSHV